MKNQAMSIDRLPTAAVLACHFVLLPQHASGSDPFCKFNDQLLQLFTACLFLAGAVAAIIGSWTCRK